MRTRIFQKLKAISKLAEKCSVLTELEEGTFALSLSKGNSPSKVTV